MDLLTHKYEKLVRQVAAGEHIIMPEVKYKYSTEKGDGFIGVIKAIEIVGQNKSIDVIVKFASDSEKLRKEAPIREAFLTEILFYERVVKEQIRIQIEHGIDDPFVNYAKCFGVNRNLMEETLFLENLKQHGYVLWDRKKPMNHGHLQFVFRQYGRFHATNYAIQHLNPDGYKELTKDMGNVLALFNCDNAFSDLVVKISSKITGYFHPVSEKKYYDACIAFDNNILQHFNVIHYDDPFSVILHGDCWCNNMMFKYKNANEQQSPESIILLDFQLAKQGSPVHDLSYFFYVCADVNAFERLEEYLQIYHQSLSEHLVKFGLDSNAVYPYEKLVEHWKKVCNFGYIMALFLIKIMLSDKDEVPDLVDVAETKSTNESNVLSSFDFETRYDEDYKRRMRDLVRHFTDNDFF